MIFYIDSLNKFYHLYWGLCTEDDLDYLNEIEKEWKPTIPKYSLHEAINIFPEAKNSAKRGVKKKIKELKNNQDIYELSDYINATLINKLDFRLQPIFKEALNNYIDELLADKVRRIKREVFNLSMLEEGVTKTDKITKSDIEKVKTIPLSNFYQENTRSGFGRCPFHKERTGSFKVYPSQNSWWCYGCNEGGSVIDYIMKRDNLDFLSAVKFLLK